MHFEIEARRHVGTKARRVAGLALFLLMLVSTGCANMRTIQPQSVVDTLGSVDAELDFWDEIATHRAVTNNDALHGLLLAAGETNVVGDAARLDAARARGWIGPNQTLEMNETATLGLIAMGASEILGIRGGLTAHLLGPSPRTATRELIFRRLIPRRSDNQSVSGLEFIDIVNRCEDFLSMQASTK